jgi:16S rRNA (cytosine967-C5)-methyltransferase
VKVGIAPRFTAAGVVGRVVREGAWTQQALAPVTSLLSDIDRKQAEALTFGTIRRLQRIDRGIEVAASRQLADIDPPVLDALRVATFEIWFGRAPTAVAVDTGVEVVRSISGRAAGFANALLRRLASGEPALGTGRKSRALELGLPEWLVEDLDRCWGEEETASFALASLADAPVSVRHRPGTPAPAGEPVPGIPDAYVIEPGRLGPHPLQDPSSVAVGHAVRAHPGDLVADLAAAPGGKTMHLVDVIGPPVSGGGGVVALDNSVKRVVRASRRAPEATWMVGDANSPPLKPATFDRVLLDAPCSGFGTLRRRPEIRHRVTAARVAELADLQKRMLASALALVKPGGRLVYSVCTVAPAETIDVVSGFGAGPPEGLPGRIWGGGLLLAPHLTGTDGMFIAVIEPK